MTEPLVPDLPPELEPRTRAKWIVIGVLVTMLALLVGSLFLPVCVPIDTLAFENQMSLEERAARGEPFQKKGRRWYQCKSRLARAFFF